MSEEKTYTVDEIKEAMMRARPMGDYEPLIRELTTKRVDAVELLVLLFPSEGETAKELCDWLVQYHESPHLKFLGRKVVMGVRRIVSVEESKQ